MPNLQLRYAVKPLRVNQPFGANPEYYAKFGDQGHPGVDFYAPHATPLYAPAAGGAFYTKDSHGGDGIYIRTPDNASPQYNVILWHLCSKDDPQYHPLIPCDGSVTPVTLGQLIGYTDNTGAPYESSGDHLHFGLMPCDFTGEPLQPNNGFHGCIDPMSFFTGDYAQDIANLEQQLSLVQKVVAYLKKLLNLP